jgi:hypothetical protein
MTAAVLVVALLLAATAAAASLRRLSDRHVFHEWSGWSEPRRGTYPWSKPIQDRHCLSCNKVGRRKVKTH